VAARRAPVANQERREIRGARAKAAKAAKAVADYSVVQYFTDVSSNKFTLTQATSVAGYTFDDPGTSVDAAGVTLRALDFLAVGHLVTWGLGRGLR
jgi:hypothetical protein